jgi:RsiW-degrading membrane proteinase PrsW (M82 family)
VKDRGDAGTARGQHKFGISMKAFCLSWRSDDLPAAAVVGLGGVTVVVGLVLGFFALAAWRPQPLSIVEIVALFGFALLLLGATLYLARLLLRHRAGPGSYFS